jgi:hypothetical protein
MFQLTDDETARLRSQIVTSKPIDLRSQIVTSKKASGGRRYNPYVFTEQGVAMLSSVLRSEKAIQVNIEIMRAFVLMRRMMTETHELALRLDALEEHYDKQFAQVFDAIRQLMTDPSPNKHPVGFKVQSSPQQGKPNP